jgi:hypothetical protein
MTTLLANPVCAFNRSTIQSTQKIAAAELDNAFRRERCRSDRLSIQGLYHADSTPECALPDPMIAYLSGTCQETVKQAQQTGSVDNSRSQAVDFTTTGLAIGVLPDAKALVD